MDTPDALGLLLRVAGSLAAVVGLVWMVRRGMLKQGGGRARAAVGSITVLARQQLSGRASVALVQVGETGLLVGVTEQQVTLLASQPVEQMLARPEAPAAPAARRTAVDLDAVVPAPASRHAAPAVPAAPAAPQEVPAEVAEALAAVPAPRGPLAGSALSPGTWAQAVDVLRERTTRR